MGGYFAPRYFTGGYFQQRYFQQSRPAPEELPLGQGGYFPHRYFAGRQFTGRYFTPRLEVPLLIEGSFAGRLVTQITGSPVFVTLPVLAHAGVRLLGMRLHAVVWGTHTGVVLGGDDTDALIMEP